jgi:hypothetical protein
MRVADLREVLARGRGLGDPSGADIAAIQQSARDVRALAAAGDPAGAQAALANTEALYAAAGSPSIVSDDVQFARDAAAGDAGALAAIRTPEQQAAIDANAVAAAPSFADNANTIGFLPALFVPAFDAENELAVPGRPLASATESAAAEMRQLPGPFRAAAAPQSGRDLTTKPPVPLPKSTSRVAVGAAVGGAVGFVAGLASRSPSGSAVVVGSLIGAALGGAAGYVASEVSP